MAKPGILEQSFARGLVTDLARNAMPAGSWPSGVDWLPSYEGDPLQKRGGWTMFKDASALTGTSVSRLGFGYTQNIGPPVGRLFIVSSTGKVMVMDPDGTTRQPVVTMASPGRPVNADLYMVFPQGNANAHILLSGDGSTVTSVNYPRFSYCDFYKGRVVGCGPGDAGDGATNRARRTWFSNPDDPTSYDQANVWADMDYPIKGVKALRNMILYFSDHHVERLIGNVPPGAVGSDMTHDVIHDIGCIDHEGIARYADTAIWAAPDGVFQTDGATIPLDLTKIGGISQYWHDLVRSSPTAHVRSGIYKGCYVVAFVDGSTGAFIDCLNCDLQTRVWTRYSNIPAAAFAQAGSSSFAGEETLYFGYSTGGVKVGSLSSIWTPSGSNKADGNGTNVLPTLQTRFYEGESTKKRIREAYLGYVLKDAAADNPTLQLSYTTDPDYGSWTVIGSLPKLAVYDRKRLPVRHQGRGIAFRITQVGPSAQTSLYDLSAEVRVKEASK